LSLFVATGLAVNMIAPAAEAQDAPTPTASAPAAPTPAASAPTAPDAAKATQENMFWQSAEHSNALEDYKAYLQAYPNGVYAPLARNRIAALSAAPAATPTAGPSATPPPVAAQEPPPSAFGPQPAVDPEQLKSEVGTVDTERALNLGPDQRMELQQRLRALGLYAGPIDGDLGPGAREAIAGWQKQHDLAPTGELGPLELATLVKDSDAALSKGPPMGAAAPLGAMSPGAPPAMASAFGPPPAPVPPQALQAEIGTVATEAALAMGPPQKMELQQRLKAIGLYGGPIDGDLGPGVRAGIAEWQKRRGLAPTGELGPLQLAQLRIDSEVAFEQIASHPPVVVAPVYAPHRVYYAPRPAAAAEPNMAPAAALIGAIGLGLLGAKLGGGFGGGKGGGKGGGGKGGGGRHKEK
jgi:peptidoglycan hydrolase-like protein with peptidoglycan-binding domain